MIMPTQKPQWIWVIRRYNYETGEHQIIQYCETKEQAHKRIRELKEHDKDKPFNYVYERIENRPDLHHERLMEEWGYKNDNR